MSEEEKVTTGSATLQKTMKPKGKIWPIVLSVIFICVIAFFVAFLHWHEQPSFCSTMCHNNMQKYVDGYYSEDDSLLVSKHAEAGVTCLGCHWSQAKMMDLVHEVVLYVSDSYTDPLTDHTEFVSDEFCGTCHDGNLDEANHAATKEDATSDQIIDPHNIPDIEAHAGLNITCGDCHSVHKTSTMVCAQCHSGMVEVPEGWETPEVSINVMSNHSGDVSSDKCVTCHNDTIAPSKETAVADYQYTWNGEEFDFHNMSDELTTAHEGFVEGFSCQTCHENQSVAACATCHADVFTSDNLPEGWTAEAAEDESTDESTSTDEDADTTESTEAAASDATYTDGTYESTTGAPRTSPTRSASTGRRSQRLAYTWERTSLRRPPRSRRPRETAPPHRAQRGTATGSCSPRPAPTAAWTGWASGNGAR